MTRFDTEVQPLSPSEVDHCRLVIDAHTQKDLEIFESESGETSLFQFCNLTRTDGGVKILRQRMEFPWSNASHIRATQESLAFVLAHRAAFAKLPSYITRHVERYEREVLLMVTQVNSLEFGFGALVLWVSDDRHYRSIVRGVQFACAFIRALRRFVEQSELELPVGELAPLFEEMRELLSRPKLVKVPNKEIKGGWLGKVLRLDQVFRLHEKQTIARLLQLVYQMDALIAMADTTSKHGLVLPRVEEGPLEVHGEGLVHPFVENAVANPVQLDQEQRLLFLTGPNMAGKTTYLRAFATALYFAHLGMGVPARRFSFVPMQRLFSSITLNDDLLAGVSYFRAEALRVKAVAEAIAQGYRIVAIMDEPFKGTNVKDALDASLEILTRLATKQDCLFMFSSHLIELSEQLSASSQISRCYFEAEEGETRLRFDYLLRPGVSKQRLGVRVLHEEGVFKLLDSSPIGD